MAGGVHYIQPSTDAVWCPRFCFDRGREKKKTIRASAKIDKILTQNPRLQKGIHQAVPISGDTTGAYIVTRFHHAPLWQISHTKASLALNYSLGVISAAMKTDTRHFFFYKTKLKFKVSKLRD